jgi:hypothetical protein
MDASKAKKEASTKKTKNMSCAAGRHGLVPFH